MGGERSFYTKSGARSTTYCLTQDLTPHPTARTGVNLRMKYSTAMKTADASDTQRKFPLNGDGDFHTMYSLLPVCYFTRRSYASMTQALSSPTL